MNPFCLPVAELKPALIGLGKIINKRSTLPVLSHVRVERTPDARIQLAATDLDTAVVVQLDTPTEGEPAALLVPFEDLHHVVKGCRGDDTVILDQVAKQRIALRFPVAGQTIEHGCDSLPVEEFPPITEITGEAVTLDTDLRRALHEAWQCASTDPTRLILNGAFLDVSKPKTHYVVGTDGRHLFSSNSFALPLAESLLIPGHRFLEWREFQADGNWALKIAKPEKDGPLLFELASSRWRYIARSIEGSYPNWRAIQPEPGSALTTVEFAADSLDALVQLIARLPNHNETHFTIGVEINGGRLRLLAKSAEQDDWRRVKVEGARPVGVDAAILLNRHLLTKALRFGLTKLEIVDCLSPVRFSADGRQMIIMPIRPETSPAKPPSRPTSPSAATTQPEPSAPNPPPTAEPQKGKSSMPDQSDNSHGASRAASTANSTAEKTALETALAQVEVIRGEFRNAIAGLNKLADALKQVQRDHKAGEKEIQSVRQTLRSLQSVRI